MTYHDPLRIANQAQQLSRHDPANSRAFATISTCCLGAIALASVVQVLMPLLRELHGHGRGR